MTNVINFKSHKQKEKADLYEAMDYLDKALTIFMTYENELEWCKGLSELTYVTLRRAEENICDDDCY